MPRIPRQKNKRHFNWYRKELVHIENTFNRGVKGTIRLLEEYPDLVKVRRYVDEETGRKRTTVEVEVWVD